MRIQLASRAHASAERTAQRLSDQFRTDVHGASAAAVDNSSANEKAFARLELDNGRVAEYSRSRGAVLRLESGGSQPTRREDFIFPSAAVLTIEQKSAPQRLALTIVLTPTEQAPTKEKQIVDSIPTSLCAEPALGRDLRFGMVETREEAER
jgi:hypothetical protein